MKFNAKLLKTITIISVAAVGLGLTVSALLMLSKHSETVNELSEKQALINIEETGKIVSNKIDDYNLVTVDLGSRLRQENDRNNLTSLISSFQTELKNEYNDEPIIKYFVRDTIIDKNGNVTNSIDSNDSAFDYRKTGKTDPIYLGSYFNQLEYLTGEQMQYFEFYYGFNSSVLDISGISIYYLPENIKGFIGESGFNNDCAFGALINDNNVIYSYKDTDNFKRESYDFIENIRMFFGTKDVTDNLNNLLNSNKTGTIFAKKSGVDYVIAVYSSDKIGDLHLVEVYRCDILSPSNKTLINSVISVIVLFLVVIIGTIAYFIIRQAKLSRKLTDSESKNLVLGCLNRHGFEKECGQIFERENNVYYGVIIFEIRHFKYLNDTYGDSEISSILRHIKTVTNQFLHIEEVYAYADHGEFLMAVHAKDKADLISKLKVHSFSVGKYKGSDKQIQLSLKYGIYEHLINDTTPVAKMIDFAREANNSITKASSDNVDMQFNFYDDKLRKIRLINEDMELRQEQALKDGEFQVFYQAKYNLKKARQDGAEALVRWYDPKTGKYNLPALFMPLFESNGFIEKLDKYVYTKVCEYISYSIANGKHVFPVSVNVSRITAIQPDFIDFYSRMKTKYGIANNAITIEFTESFAYENYDVLRTIVDKLHANGFEVSIDDFGCGYSSYRILKELPMDEIKLDKFFIDHSNEPERVDYIYDSIISLAQNLKMKVTQEGVETESDVELLKQHGCDVVQGFIYSKPISLTDYLHFCEESNKHKL